MPDPAPSNNNDPNGGGAADPNAGGTPPPAAGGSSDFDPSKLSPADLTKVLEHPDFFKIPRIADLVKSSGELKKLQDKLSKDEEERLKADKKWEELATSKDTENGTLKQTIQNMQIDQALTNKLVPVGVVDLEAALKLADRSKITVDENGNVQGVDAVIEQLKTDKTYLFGKPGQPQVGQPTTPGSNPSGPAKFKRSQLRDPQFYKEHQKEILEAMKAGLIEDDIS